MLAVEAADMEAMKFLLDQGARIDCRDNFGQTTLMYPASIGNCDIVKLLLANSANIDVESSNGTTAIKIALKQRHVNIVELLSNKK